MTACVLWAGYLTEAGYGRLGPRLAHRIAYEREIGPIPVGLELDHTCNNRACVNVEHLEPVTHAENKRRAKERLERERTTCPQGHPWTAENVYTNPRTGWKACRVCRRESMRRSYQEAHLV